MHIDIIDYGFGNIKSIIRMIEKIGGSAKTISTIDEIRTSNKIILPGVGNFDNGMKQIIDRGLFDALNERIIKNGVPVLGICLGMQLMCVRSEEGSQSGLGYVDAEVHKFKVLPNLKIKIPHMGWNSVHVERENSLIEANDEEHRFYFVHSYYVKPNNANIEILTSNHGHNFCAAFERDNIFGVQFHPEKSHRYGMKLLNRFASL